MPDSPGSYQKIVEAFKSTLSLLRESALILLVVLLLFWPEWISSVLQRAGISEVGPFKLQTQLIAAQENAQEANQMIAKLQTELEESRRIIADLQNRPDLNPEIEEQISEAKNRIDFTYETSALARNKLRTNIAAQSEIIDQFEQPERKDNNRWAIVVGADRSLEQARYELNRFRQRGFEQVQIYIRDDWFRTVILTGSYDRAQKQLPAIKRDYSESAYIVNLAEWCPQLIEREPGVVYECQ